MPVADGETEMFFEKVFLYVSTSAAPTTRMTLIAPEDAYLYYTDSNTWQSPIDDATMIHAATKSVSVSRTATAGPVLNATRSGSTGDMSPRALPGASDCEN
jgi:hypothetical protein